MSRKLLFLFAAFWASFVAAAELPYPVIFIHGLDSDDQTWDNFLDGTLSPALGISGEVPVFHVLANSDLQETQWQGADGTIGTNDDDILIANPGGAPTVPSSPVYKINFRCWRNDSVPYDVIPYTSRPATPYNLAFNSAGNESAITKQAIALSYVISRVLNATGKDQVILVGHSAGGLVAREYLQRRSGNQWTPTWWVNPSEPNGHHVARLVTLGTPHLGSNLGNLPTVDQLDSKPVDSLAIALLTNVFSELVRDIRYSYGLFNLIHGVYLFGGDENAADGDGYHNYDINCEGDEADEYIVGISDWETWSHSTGMPLTADIEYLWCTTRGAVDGTPAAWDGDGVV